MSKSEFINFITVASHFLNSYVAAVIAVTGFLLNIFSIYIFRKGDRGRTIPAIHYYLTTLLMWESGVLANILIHALPGIIWGRPLPFAEYFPIYLANVYGAITTSTAVVWVLVTLTVDRYLALCYPMKHRRIGTRSKAKTAMVVISLLAMVYTIPEILEITKSERCKTDARNVTVCFSVPDHTDLAKNQIYWAVYRVFLGYTFVSVGPCILLCVLTFKISMALKKEFKERRRLLASNAWSSRGDAKVRNREMKSNLLLVIIIVKSTVCSIQPTIFNFLRLVIGEADFRGPYVGIWYYLNDFFNELDYATNFFVFIFFGKMFRQTCIDILSGTYIGKALSMRMNVAKTSEISNTSGTQMSEYSTRNKD